MRLNKFLSRCGLDSRRKCDDIIRNKKISINGSVVTDFSYQVKEDDVVTYNNKYLEIEDQSIIYILNKPKGYVCTSKDPQNRLKVIDLIDTNIRLFTVGRLDRDTTGGRDGHRNLLEEFASGQADVLIGTQMLAKGIDLPKVTIAAVSVAP